MINIILCGGSGTRLWPLSRTMLPKQFFCQNGVARNKKYEVNWLEKNREGNKPQIYEYCAEESVLRIENIKRRWV